MKPNPIILVKNLKLLVQILRQSQLIQFNIETVINRDLVEAERGKIRQSTFLFIESLDYYIQKYPNKYNVNWVKVDNFRKQMNLQVSKHLKDTDKIMEVIQNERGYVIIKCKRKAVANSLLQALKRKTEQFFNHPTEIFFIDKNTADRLIRKKRRR